MRGGMRVCGISFLLEKRIGREEASGFCDICGSHLLLHIHVHVHEKHVVQYVHLYAFLIDVLNKICSWVNQVMDNICTCMKSHET
jgi:hypothetical protein